MVKTSKVITMHACICALILGMLGAVAAQTQSATATRVKVRYSPSHILLDKNPPKWFFAFIQPLKPYTASQINSSTILLEGVLPKSNVWWRAPLRRRVPWSWSWETRRYKWLPWFTATFDGEAVTDILLAKIFHLGIVDRPVYKIEVSISGEFKDGTPFEGSGVVILQFASRSVQG